MIADIFSDLELRIIAVIVRGVGIAALVLLAFESWLRFQRRPLEVPLMFTTITDRAAARSEWERTSRLASSVKVIEQMTSVRAD